MKLVVKLRFACAMRITIGCYGDEPRASDIILTPFVSKVSSYVFCPTRYDLSCVLVRQVLFFLLAVVSQTFPRALEFAQDKTKTTLRHWNCDRMVCMSINGSKLILHTNLAQDNILMKQSRLGRSLEASCPS